MKKMKWITTLLVSAALTVSLNAQNYSSPFDETPGEIDSKSELDVSHEFLAEYSYTASSALSQGEYHWGDISNHYNNVQYVASLSVADDALFRIGIDWERFSFNTPGAVNIGTRAAPAMSNAPIPNTLQSIAAVIGTDLELDDEWIMRIEIYPGVYSDFQDISFDDINMPAIVGASYLIDKDLQWFFGMSINPRSYFPVIPGVGVRWKFEDDWTLMFVLPRPRIEYNITKDLLFYVGASFKAGNYQVAKDFGNAMGGRTDINNDNVEYREIRTGGGFNWEFSSGLKLEAEAGWTIDRRFEYSQSDLMLDSQGAPYGKVAFTAAF
jgi:hypothetical protein